MTEFVYNSQKNSKNNSGKELLHFGTFYSTASNPVQICCYMPGVAHVSVGNQLITFSTGGMFVVNGAAAPIAVSGVHVFVMVEP